MHACWMGVGAICSHWSQQLEDGYTLSAGPSPDFPRDATATVS